MNRIRRQLLKGMLSVPLLLAIPKVMSDPTVRFPTWEWGNWYGNLNYATAGSYLEYFTDECGDIYHASGTGYTMDDAARLIAHHNSKYDVKLLGFKEISKEFRLEIKAQKHRLMTDDARKFIASCFKQFISVGVLVEVVT